MNLTACVRHDVERAPRRRVSRDEICIHARLCPLLAAESRHWLICKLAHIWGRRIEENRARIQTDRWSENEEEKQRISFFIEEQ